MVHKFFGLFGFNYLFYLCRLFSSLIFKNHLACWIEYLISQDFESSHILQDLLESAQEEIKILGSINISQADSIYIDYVIV